MKRLVKPGMTISCAAHAAALFFGFMAISALPWLTALSSPGMLFLRQGRVRFEPDVRLGGRRFFARLSINHLARLIGRRSLLSHLCYSGCDRDRWVMSVAGLERPEGVRFQ